MQTHIKSICYILIFTILFTMLGINSFHGPVSHAAESDSTKVITIYTEPENISFGENLISETGLGLDTLVSPSYASGYDITWESSDTDIATVDENGHVHGRLTGKYANSDRASCIITATVRLGELVAQDYVQVLVKRGYDLTYVSISPASMSLKTGESKSIHVDYPDALSDAVRDEIYVVSSNPEIAFAGDDGTITGISEGTAVITVYTINGHSDSCTVTVTSGDTSKSTTAASPSSDGMILVCDSSVSNSNIKTSLADHGAEYEGMVRKTDGEKAVLTAITEETDIEGLLEEVRTNDDIKYVQPNFRYTLADDDPSYNIVKQYFHFHAGFDKAWSLMESNGISGTTLVGVVDSGIDAAHTDLASNLILDGGSYTRFENGVKIKDTKDTVSSGHGTHVAGIIGAVYGNGLHGAGAAAGKNNDYSKIIPVGALGKESGTLNTYDIICAMNHAVDQGARIINLSLSGGYRDRLFGSAVQSLYYNDKVVFVGSAGNGDDHTTTGTDYGYSPYKMSYPSDLSEVIDVCNINNNSVKHSSSNYGFAKDISATGVTINSTLPGNKFGPLTGTSMSAPVVSAASALILDVCPDLKPWEVRNIICGTSQDPSGYFKTNELGYGELDAYAAVEAAYRIKNGEKPDSISISIKTPYRTEKTFEKTTTTYKVTVPALKGIKKTPLKKKAVISFNRPVITIRKNVKTTVTDPFTSDTAVKSNKTTESTKKAGTQYKVSYRLKGTSTWKNLTIPAVTRTTEKYSVKYTSSRVNIRIKKLKSKKVYYIKVRPFSKVAGKTYYGKWTTAKKIKTK